MDGHIANLSELTKLADDLGFVGGTADEVGSSRKRGSSLIDWLPRLDRLILNTMHLTCARCPLLIVGFAALTSVLLSLAHVSCGFQAKKCFANLYRMFLATDATQVEVNPLAETPEGKGTTPVNTVRSLAFVAKSKSLDACVCR